MAGMEQPVTRAELRAELQSFREEFHRELQHYATKADLANLRAELRGDLNRIAIGLAGLQLISIGVVAAVVKALG